MAILDKLTEGIVSRDLSKESNALLSKWEKTGLLEGMEADQARQGMARQREDGIFLHSRRFPKTIYNLHPAKSASCDTENSPSEPDVLSNVVMNRKLRTTHRAARAYLNRLLLAAFRIELGSEPSRTP